jgi:hypothetical protein
MGPALNIHDYREQFEKMSLDELWALHWEVGQIFAARLAARREELERRLQRLSQTTGRQSSSKD